MGPKATRLSMMPKASSTARPDWARTMNLVGLASFLLTAIAISTIMAAATTTPKKMSCGMQLLTTSATSSRLTPIFARVRSRVFHCFPPFIVPPSGWRLTGFPLLLMILYQNNFLSAHFLHKLLFPLHVLQKFQKHFIFCCASLTKHLDPVLCTPPKHQKWPGALS